MRLSPNNDLRGWYLGNDVAEQEQISDEVSRRTAIVPIYRSGSDYRLAVERLFH